MNEQHGDSLQMSNQAESLTEAPKKSAWREILESIIIAVVLAFVIRYFLFQPFYIPSGSMEPTLRPLDRIIVSKVHLWFSEPQQGDIIVFRYPKDPSRDFVKRVIAKGGDTVEIRSNQVYVNNQPIKEPYLPPVKMADYKPTKIADGQFFVMGDNRNHSDDSRFWGLVPRENLVGKAVIIYWPLQRMHLLGEA